MGGRDGGGGQDPDEAHTQVEYVAHLVRAHSTRVLQRLEEWREPPAPSIDQGLAILRQNPHQIPRDPPAGDVRDAVEVTQDRPHGGHVAAVHGQEGVGHGLTRISKRVLELELHDVEDDPARQGVAVGVETGRGIAQQNIPRDDAIPVQGFVFTNNVARHSEYGIIGTGRGPGRDTIDAYLPSARIAGNIIAGADAGRYPPGNQYPSVAELDTRFADAPKGDFRLVQKPSPATAAKGRNRATDSVERPPGADLAAIPSSALQ